MTEDARIISEYRAAFRRLAGSGIIDMDHHLRHTFNFQIHRLEVLIDAIGGDIPANRQSQFFLNFLKKGSGEKTIGNEHFLLRPNTLVAVPSRMTHSSIYFSTQLSGYVLGFNIDFFLSDGFPKHLIADKHIFRHSARHFLYLTAAQARQFIPIYESLLEEYATEKPHRNEFLILKVLELVIRSCRLLEQPGLPKDADASAALIDRFNDLLHQHYREQRSVTFYAAALHLHPNHLNALVKKYTGLSAKATITGFLLAEARHLLQSSSMRVKEVAHYLGFTDPDQFSALFRKHLHVPPTQFKDR